MARARKKKKESVELEDEELDPAARDFVMARLGAGRAAAQSAINMIDDALALFVDPEEDDDGEERGGLVEDALESLGTAARCLEAAEQKIEDVDPNQLEPWDDDTEDEE